MNIKDLTLMRGLDIVAAILLIIGGLNWGLVGIFGIDLVAGIFGSMTFFSRIIYALVGFSAIYEVVMWKAIPRRWGCSVFTRAQTPGTA